MTTRPLTMTVVKRHVNARTVNGGTVTLFEGTELSMILRHDNAYEGVIASGQQRTGTGTILLTQREAADWCVFRAAEDLGYRP